MNRTKVQRSPLSPRLRPPKSPQIQSKIEQITSKYLSLSGKNLAVLSTNPTLHSPLKLQNGKSNVTSQNLLFLDLSNNKLQSTSLKNVSQTITILNLSNNPLVDCAFPSFPNLRTLKMDNCGLKNFDGMPYLPSLIYLSAANNQITSFKGLKILPELESIILMGNPVEFAHKMIIQAVASLNLQKIDREIIDRDDIISAFKLSPLVGYALRSGRSVEVCDSDEEEIEKSQEFLTMDLRKYLQTAMIEAKPVLEIESHGENEHVIALPFKAKNIKWFKSHSPNDRGIEWFHVKTAKRDSNILPITMNVRLHIIKCDFSIDEKVFSIYTDDLVGRESNDLALPCPIDPVIAGTPIEGSLMSVLPMPFQSRVAWLREGVTVAEDVTSIVLTEEDVGKSIACLLQPHIPFDNTIVFGTVFTATDVVAPLLPIVTGITFPDTIIEGQKITFDRVMNPDREGDSAITVERSVSQYGEWILVAELKKDDISYTPNQFDVGKYLRLSYTPITPEGTSGATVFFYSKTTVLPTMPTFKNPIIGGVAKTFYPLVALADYTGGIKGKCTYDWYFSKRPIDVRKGPNRRLQKVAINTQYFTPDSNMADGYLACYMIPVRIDEVVGEPVFVSTDGPIQLDDPPKPIEGCPTEAIVGKTLKFPITVEMYLSKTSGMCGFDLLKTGQTYTPREKHMGRVLRVVAESTDIMIGEIKPATPQILDVSISADKYCPGEILSLAIKHKHLMPDKVEIVWIRCNSEFEIPVAMDNPEYTIQPKDIGFQLKAAVTPMDYTGRRLETKTSPLSPVIRVGDFVNPQIFGDLQEDHEIAIDCDHEISSLTWYRVEGTKDIEVGKSLTYRLTSKEVGYFMKAKIVTEKSGITLTVMSNEVVRPAPPTVSITVPPQIVQGQLVIPQVNYHGGTEGESEIKWYRETDDGFDFIKTGLQYQTSQDDVDCVLRLVYTPKRIDGLQGDQVVIECGPVDPLVPSVSNVTITQNAVGNIEVSGVYKGGFEGMSFIIWRYYNDDAEQPINLGKTVEREMPPQPNLVGKLIDAVFVPIRNDGMAGQPVISSNKVRMKPLPSVIAAEILVKGGQLIPGALMRCRATFDKGDTGEYKWERGDGKFWEDIEGANEVECTLTHEEVGFFIRCTVFAINKAGWRSAPFYAVTNTHVTKLKTSLCIVEPLDKKNEKMKSLITGTLLSSNLPLDQLSRAKLKWQKMVDGKWKTLLHDDTYLVTVNDVGYNIRCVTKNGKASEPSRTIELNPIIASYVKSIVKTNQFKVKAKAKIGVVVWTISIFGNEIKLSTKSGTQKPMSLSTVTCEAVVGTPDEMHLSLDPSSNFTLIPDLSDDKRTESTIKKENVRDFVVATIRAFIEKNKK